MPRLHPTTLLLALALPACERTTTTSTATTAPASEPARAATGEVAAAASEPPEQSVPQLVLPEIPDTPPDRTSEQLRELHQKYRRQLVEARRLRETDELDAASREYLALLEIDPTDTLVLRELAGVAEQRGDFAGAEAALARALRFTREKAGQIELRGELARVLELAGKPEQAREHLRESLVSQESAEVRAELNAAGEAFVTLEQACEHLYRTIECEHAPDCSVEDAWKSCTFPDNEEIGGMFTYERESWSLTIFPAVKTSLGWTLFEFVADLPMHGTNGTMSEYEANEFIHRHGGHAYAVVEVTSTIRDADEGIEQVSFDMARSVVACRADGPVARCASFYVDSDSCSGGLFDDLDCKPMDTYRIVGDEVVVRHGKKDVRREPIEAGLCTSRGPLP